MIEPASARPSRALRPAVAFVECPTPVYLLGGAIGVLGAIVLLLILGALH